MKKTPPPLEDIAGPTISSHGVVPRNVTARLDPLVLTAVAVSIALMFTRLGDAAFWFDEMFTVSLIKMPWGEMLHAILVDNPLPLYFLIVKGWSLIAGDSPFSLRTLNAIFSVLIVVLVAAIAWIVKGRVAARWAAWFAALSPYLLQHGQEVRMYPLLGLLAAVIIFLLVRFISETAARRDKKLGAAFVLANAALLATHYYAVFFVIAELAAMLLIAWPQRRSWAQAMAISVLLIFVPVFTAMRLSSHSAGSIYDIGLFALPGLFWSLFSGYTLLPSSELLHEQGIRAALPFAPFAIAGLSAVAILSWSAIRSLSLQYILFLGTIIGAVVLGPFVISLFFNIGINPRYAMACIPALIVFVAAGAPNTMQDRTGLIAAGSLLGIMVAASSLHLANPGHGREDVYALGHWLNENVPVEEEILVTSHEMAIFAAFHWPDRRFITYPPRKVVVTEENVSRVADEFPVSKSGRVIYIFGRTWLSDPEKSLRTALKKRYTNCGGTEVRGIEVLCLNATP